MRTIPLQGFYLPRFALHPDFFFFFNYALNTCIIPLYSLKGGRLLSTSSI